MKRISMLFFFSIFIPITTFSQVSVLDSIIASQPDSLTRAKLMRFKSVGVGKPLVLNDYKPDDLISSAKKYLGMPHCMGGNGKTSRKSDGRMCIDCSGLLYASFNDMGFKLDIHSSQELARYGEIISDTSQIKKGDILFFVRSYHSSKPEIVITHAGIALGDGQMIHTSASNGVEIAKTDSEYWASRFLYATRVFSEE